jgi:DNA repair protein RecN (Recombination protein N)
MSLLDREENTLCNALAVLLSRLNNARLAAAGALGSALEEELRGLGFPDQVAVEFAFTPFSLHAGRDDCVEQRARMLWKPNPGQTAQPLDRIASGGELSRFLLALISLKSRRATDNPTLIFDEVDAGVGGLILGRVAQRLCALAASTQVLLITHWPQLAVGAHRHFHVRKEVRDGDTFTLCETLASDRIREELARMAGGGTQGEALTKELLGQGA